jgi:hypothetical protein
MAVHEKDVAVVQTSPWGCAVMLASDGSRFEVEHTIEQMAEMLPALRLRTDETFIDPDHISSIWEEGGKLHYTIRGGLKMTQSGVDLHEFLAALEQGQPKQT